MPTLVGAQVDNYLDHLASQVNRISDGYPEESVASLSVQVLRDLIRAEKMLLQRLHSQGGVPMLALTDQGMSTIATFNADLDAICSISDSDEVFSKIRNSRVDGKPDVSNDGKYSNVSHDDFMKRLQAKKEQISKTKLTFSLSQNNSGQLVIDVANGYYVDGYDKTSQVFPILRSWGSTTFGLEFNELTWREAANYGYYSNEATSALVLPDKGTYFDAAIFEKKRERADFEMPIPWYWKISDWEPNDRNAFIVSGQRARHRLAVNVLTAFNNVLKEEVNFENEEAVLRAVTYDGYNNNTFKNLNTQNLQILKENKPIATITYNPSYWRSIAYKYTRELVHIPGSTLKTKNQLSLITYYFRNQNIYPLKNQK